MTPVAAQIADAWRGSVLAVASIVGAAAVHIAALVIRRLETRAQACIVEAMPARAPAEEPPPMSWFSKYILGPITAAIAGTAVSTDPQVKAANASVQLAINTDLATVNPLFDVAAAEVEAAADKLLQSLGPLGYVAEGAVVNPVFSLAAGMLKQAIDHKLGIAPLPAAPAA